MLMAEVPNLVPALPEVFLVCAAMALLMLGVFQKVGGPKEEVQTTRLISGLGVIALVLTTILAATLTVGTTKAFGGLFVTDPFGLFFKVLALVASAIAIIMSQSYLERQGIARFEYGILILFAAVGMMMMISANDLISLYVGLELQSLALYVVAAFQRDDARSTEAGLKYFVLGALASGMLLYGMSLIYGFTGTTNFDVLAKTFAAADGAPALGVTFGLVFMLAGLAFKISAVPFHMWTPDVYEGAPTPVTAFFSVAPKVAAIALLVRVMVGPFGDLIQQWQQIIWFISILSMLLGAFAAINQRNIKRMMAYSSIGHVGYALIGLTVGTEEGISGVLVYMAIYVFMNLGVFACILTMHRSETMVENIDDLAGMSKSHPWIAAAMTVFMFSMAGIPPMAGFFGKLYIFKAAIAAEFYWLAVIGVLSSVVGAFYYLRIIKMVYFDDLTNALDRSGSKALGWVIGLCGVAILGFWIVPSYLFDSANQAVSALFAG